ncbi:hypothetical protein TraAM80_07033 [Trypanosoma rangeli]|uniref:CS domain-containing protein n=1 Tax=Trypanosoma rangeli TaxID=5698 RepID=A0A422N770_TRYRA|nr:uncharacterized protein TraAM80_07033 [Trypanosoma rangeli]RNF01334.1 hypothetical protein TraAM80_07033 [Trypanosoma rangeli]|eukprot:RNF01334.1 hypothetical protein TraAM80_07033 [Trypanosoma rangeli]
MSASKDVVFPNIFWAQRSEYIFLSIPLQDARNVAVEIIDGRMLHFAATAGERSYGCVLELLHEVSSEESSHVTTPRQIEVKLKKKWPNDAGDEEAAALCRAWPRLTKDKTKNCHIQVDWSRWKDEDDDTDTGEGGLGFDYGNMMSEMMMPNGLENGEAMPFTSEAEHKSGSANLSKNDEVETGNNKDDDYDDLPPLEG